MIIFPAIDIKEGKCVRLVKGDFDKQTIYEDDPVKQALKWQRLGAKYLHIVDLDGAKEGIGINEQIIKRIIEAIEIPVQVGGGIRDIQRAKRLLEMGVARVIVGTMAIEDIDSLKKLIDQYGSKICVSIDAKKGMVATRGWLKETDVKAIELAQKLEKMGLKTIVYTDIEKDGMLQGPNFEEYRVLSANTNLDIIASGGISKLSDIKTLEDENMYGTIVGKALYDGKVLAQEVF